MKTLVKSDQFKSMPWKNGLGVTSEICIYPENSEFTKGDFLWRLSSAKIKAQNTFSNFPGYDRLLTVLSGQGLMLNDHKLLKGEVYKFRGEEKIDCELLGSEVEDLGLIFNREKCRCEMKIFEFDQKTTLKFENGTHFLKSLTEKSDILKIEGADQVEINSEKLILITCEGKK